MKDHNVENWDDSKEKKDYDNFFGYFFFIIFSKRKRTPELK